MRVLITGTTGGLGSAVARAFLADTDADVTGIVRGLGRTTLTGPRFSEIALDLADADAVDAWMPDGPADALVHCAAVGDNVRFAASSPAEWERFLGVNVIAAATLTRRVAPTLSPGGSVVFLNSGLGLRASGASVPYSAAKAALRSLADGIRPELAEQGIRVTTVYPGQIATPMLERNVAELGRQWQPESYIDPAELARLVVQITTSGRSLHLTDVVVRPVREPW